MINIDGHQIDYPDDNVSRRFRDWLTTPVGRAVEHEFNHYALNVLKIGNRVSGYAIIQFIRPMHSFKIANDYGPIFSRLAVAKHPELGAVFQHKPTGWGKTRKSVTPRLL